MAILRAETKRAVLNSLYADALTKAQSLDEAISAFLAAQFSIIKNGHQVISTSGAGHSVTFRSTYQSDENTALEMFNLAQELSDVSTDAKTVLTAAGNLTPTDLQLKTQMLLDDRMQTITFVQRDHLMTRWAAR